MNRNFAIKDAVLFEFLGEVLDLRSECELASVHFQPGIVSSVEMLWSISGSNQHLQILFTQVHCFLVKERDQEYPLQSGVTLLIAGFSSRNLPDFQPELYVEPTYEMNYMTFVMNDSSAFLIKAESGVIRRL
jgi:hypothetical protein